jgi:hypothetical protein
MIRLSRHGQEVQSHNLRVFVAQVMKKNPQVSTTPVHINKVQLHKYNS